MSRSIVRMSTLLAGSLVGSVCWADKLVGAYGAFSASVADNFACSERVSIKVTAGDPAAFKTKRAELEKALASARQNLSLDCSEVGALAVRGLAGGKVVYSGTAEANGDWELVDNAPAPPAATTNRQATASGDAFDAFRKAPPKPQRTNPAQTAAPSEAVAAAPAPSARKPAPAARGGYQFHCSGNLNRYTGSQFTGTETFEFRGVLNPTERSFRVINVMLGPLFSSGSSYPVLAEDSGVLTISADSTNPRYVFSTVNLDTETMKVNGKGGVSLDDVRGRVRDVFGQMGVRRPQGGSPMGEKGLDSMRRVDVDGLCVTR